jgi:hypothetical protein
MHAHLIHDLGQEPLIERHARVTAECGKVLREAHEVKRPEGYDICPQCYTVELRNRYQNFRYAVELSPQS